MSTQVLALFIDEKLVFQRKGGMFSNEPVYLASFEFELLAFRFHLVLPGYMFIKVNSEVFNHLCLRYDCLVDIQWG